MSGGGGDVDRTNLSRCCCCSVYIDFRRSCKVWISATILENCLAKVSFSLSLSLLQNQPLKCHTMVFRTKNARQQELKARQDTIYISPPLLLYKAAN